MSFVIGIDFGTSNSAASCVIDGEARILPDENNQRLTPSVVSFGKNHQILVGQSAKEQAYRNPARTIHSIKRLIGRKFYSSEIEKAKALLPYELVETEGQNVGIQIDERTFAPQEIAALILKKMRSIAENELKKQVEQAVVTVPAYFNDNQRQSTREACEIAGINAIRMINEPTAAALAYGFGKSLNQNIVVYDLGGGTFDLSILRLKGEVFEVIATAGDTFLGGDDFDDRLIDLVANLFLKKHGIDLRTISAALPVLRKHAEKTKQRLSYSERTDLYIPKIVKREEDVLDLHMTLSQEQLKDSCNDLIQRTFTVCDEALHQARLKASEIDEVILVGGPTKMPIVSNAVADYFGKPALSDINPDEVVSMGAAIQAHSLTAKQAAKKSLLLDVTPLDLGVATVGGYVETLVAKNSPIPAEARKTFSTTHENQTQVDIRIFQGKDRRIESSTLLGEFSLKGFPAAKAGEVAIDVKFSINTDGIVEVSAEETKTRQTQSIAVKMGAVMGTEKVFASKKKSEELHEVKLKDQWAEYQKVLVFVPSHSGVSSVYKEGYIKSFDPQAETWEVFAEDKSGNRFSMERKYVGWIALIEDFANIPRYLRTLCKRPEEKHPLPKQQLYEFVFKNNERLFAVADLPKVREEGFWVAPFCPFESLNAKVYVYSAQLKESLPILDDAKEQTRAQ